MASGNYASLCSEKTLQSNQEGFFMTFVENVTEAAGEEWVNKVFGKLTTDKERIKSLYENETTKNAICSVLCNVQELYRKKNAEVSRTRRLEADKAVKGGNNLKGLILYSQSVIRAPKTGENTNVDNGASYALALWGRAQVLISMKKHKLAISDIQQAMKENLPNEIKSRAYWKLAFCYQAIGEYNSAKLSFDLAEEFNDSRDELEVMKKEMESSSADESTPDKVVPPVIEPRHPDFPNASNKIKVSQSAEAGRYVVANEAIKTGEVLVVEPPYAACLSHESFGTHCHHCFERLVAPVSCPDCSSVAFCKEECKDAALSTYHKYECKYLDLLIGSGMSVLSHTALRMITQQSLERSLELCQDRSKERVYSLCANPEKRKPHDFLQRALMAAFLLRCLQKCGYFKQSGQEDRVIPNEEECQIGELLLFHLQMLQFNAHEIFETRFSPGKKCTGSKTAYIGVAVYPTVSLFNHECYPAVARYFLGKSIVINATRPIEPNQIVAENYGPIFTRMNITERQKSLQARYWFDCKCKPCVQNWPSFKTGLNDASSRVRCPTEKCDAVFSLPASSNSMNCPNCKNTVDLTENIASLKSCEERYENLTKTLEDSDVETASNVLCEIIGTFHRVSTPPHKTLHLAEELLRTCLANAGNVSEILLSP